MIVALLVLGIVGCIAVGWGLRGLHSAASSIDFVIITDDDR